MATLEQFQLFFFFYIPSNSIQLSKPGSSITSLDKAIKSENLPWNTAICYKPTDSLSYLCTTPNMIPVKPSILYSMILRRKHLQWAWQFPLGKWEYFPKSGFSKGVVFNAMLYVEYRYTQIHWPTCNQQDDPDTSPFLRNSNNFSCSWLKH